MSSNNSSNDTKSKGGCVAHKLARPNILQLQPYRCARDDYDSGVLLDANENAYGAPAGTLSSSMTAVGEQNLNRYPDPYQTTLKQQFLQFRGYDDTITPDHMFCGVGSDEAIDLLLRIFCKPGSDAILTCPPTYGMYKVCAAVNDVSVVTVPLLPDTFQVNVKEVIATAQSNPHIKLIFLCSPGNPTARVLSLDDMATIAAATADHQIVVIDEAYVDFAMDQSSAVSLITQEYPNICVLQTLSKAVGLAAIRCGFLLGAPDVVQLLNNVKAPYNVNSLTSAAATTALQQGDALRGTVRALMEQRSNVMAALNKLDCVSKVYPSDANFILFRLQESVDAESVYKTMANRGVVTRFRGRELHCDNCLRVTVGTAPENDMFLAMLETVVEELKK